MRILITGNWEQTTLEEIGSRYASGEHIAPPEPCKLLTRWHDPSSKLFWLVVETPDSATIQEWLSRWTDIVEWEIFSVLDDQEVGEVLEKLL